MFSFISFPKLVSFPLFAPFFFKICIAGVGEIGQIGERDLETLLGVLCVLCLPSIVCAMCFTFGYQFALLEGGALSDSMHFHGRTSFESE